VVIGGLLSATLLTLVVLPSLYIMFEKKMNKRMQTPSVTALLLLMAACLFSSTTVKAQTTRSLTQEQAIAEGIKNNNRIKAASYEADLQNALKSSATNIPKTEFLYSQGQINSSSRDNSIGVTQKIEFPTVYRYQGQLAAARVTASRRQLTLTQFELTQNIKFAINDWVYQLTRRQLLLRQDSLFGNLTKASTLRYKTGESNQLEKVTSETQLLEVKNKLAQVNADITIAKQRLQTLLNTKDDITPADTLLVKREFTLPADSSAVAANPYLAYLQQQILVNKADTKVQQARRLPDLIVGYYNQSFRGVQTFNGVTEKYTGSDRFHVVQAGIAIPILPGGNKGRIAAAKINEQVADANLQYQQMNLQGQFIELVQQYNKYKSALDYYEQSALPQADLIIKNAEKGFKSGDIAYLQYLQSLAMTVKIRSDYIDNLYWYNQTIIEIENVTGKNNQERTF
jgi:cobalt-zinc-cadmium resistance protein CzcA